MSSLVGIARDVLNLTDEVDEKAARLKILKSLISDVVDDSDIMNIIQEEIEKAEESGEEATSTDIGSDEGSAEERETRSSSEEDVDLGDLFSSEEEEPSEPASISTAEEPTDVGGEETIGELPTPDSLGLDFTQNQNF